MNNADINISIVNGIYEKLIAMKTGANIEKLDGYPGMIAVNKEHRKSMIAIARKPPAIMVLNIECGSDIEHFELVHPDSIQKAIEYALNRIVE